MSLAIDRQGLIQALYNSSGEEQGPVPAAFYPEWAFSPRDLDWSSYGPDTSKQLLAEAGYPDGFTTQLYTTPQHIGEAELIAFYMDRVGISVELVVENLSALRELASGNGYGGMMLASLATAIFPIDDYLQFFYTTDSRFNYSRLSEAVGLQQLAEAHGVELDPERRKDIVDKIQLVVADQAYFVPLPVRYTIYPYYG